ncbi:hypothetical protein [uncultured Pseudokineococcus sp.]|uniref:hypothetical protein n=1 Tax=uncultured Pseudokineococcus sp. TaxID=1642928 RepID=UPI00261C2879|nr:hypothetical protein [uncultured Pseudokineococcus sp.]
MARCLEVRARWRQLPAEEDAGTADEVALLLERAEAACRVRRGWRRHRYGGPVEAAWTNLHAAERLLVGAGWPPPWPAPEGSDGWSSEPRLAAAQLQSQHRATALEHVALRSFRSAVLLATAGTALVVIGLVLLAVLVPGTLPLCPGGAAGRGCLLTTSAGGADAVVVAVVGAASGALSGVVALRDLEVRATPFAVPGALALLKLPVGALAALLGVVLLLGLPTGVTTGPTTAPGVLAWAVVLGAAQQLVTRLADAQGRALLAKA